MESALNELKQRLLVVSDLGSAGAVLNWDQTTYMPPGGAPARGRQIATLGRLQHDHATDPAIGRLLEQLQKEVPNLDPDSDEAALIRVAQKQYDRAVKIPSEFVAKLYGHIAETYDHWTRARPDNDYASIAPRLETTLDLSRQYADYLGSGDHVADPLVDMFDEGMTVATIRDTFEQLRRELVPLVQKVSEQEVADDSCLRQYFPEDQQMAFGEMLIRRMGYDFDRGRQDKTHHPFMTKFSTGDVRITTRYRENDLSDGLFSTIHEMGHALYEQGQNPAYEGTPLDGGASAGTHESQSRLWENLVGRSRHFWEYAYPLAQKQFPDQLGNVSLDMFYRAINKVQRSLIRVDADELTYNLHVMIRFGLEMDMLEDKLTVKDLPEAWHELYRSDLGTHAPDDRDGVLQDVHWYGGMIGGVFQGYTLGNILSAQIADAARQAHPDIPEQIAHGQFDTLHDWLKTNMYRLGSKYPVPDLIEKVTGQSLTIEPYIRYLRTKYSELYGI